MTLSTKLKQAELRTLAFSSGNKDSQLFSDDEDWRNKPRMTMKEVYKGLAHIFFCKHCGKKETRSPSRNNIFCSRQCFNEWRTGKSTRKVNFNCFKCKKDFADFICRKRQYCSKICWYKRNG